MSVKSRYRKGVLTVGELESLDGVWAGRIRAPGRNGKYDNGFTVRQVVFIRSLQPLLDMSIITLAKPAQIALLVNAYWNGIAKILPEPFDSATSPQNYVIQKDQGVMALHRLLPKIIEVLPSWGRSLTDPIAYADIMHDLPTLGGEIRTDHGAELSGAAFWLSGSTGVASQLNSKAGRNSLYAALHALIPQPAEGLEV